jgi:hypothetical protein
MLCANALPEDYTPGDNDVVVGKGKKYFRHLGNEMLRQMAASMIADYDKSCTKLDKSLIISSVVDRIRASGMFVKFDPSSGRWLVAEELLCREKTSAVFRDALHDHRKAASSSAKLGKRQRDGSTVPGNFKKEINSQAYQTATLFQGLELLQTLGLGKAKNGDDDSISGLTHSLSFFREEDLNFDDLNFEVLDL